ncbi:universal stress protein [Nocardia carnea]|uniref:universal stress protein n=1 Tax=Nocardia carnea TaxID=37328 RepID=UPI00245819E5|nr:universal stress protein [Nocardia carnea]
MVLPGKHIVAGIDGSEASLGAAGWAAAFAGKLELPLHLVHSSPASGPIPDVAFSAGELEEMQQAYRSDLLNSAQAALRKWAPDVELKLIADDKTPAAGVLEAAGQAAMIVLGATGAGSVERWLLGSTVLRVANKAVCPVAIWRGDPADASPDDRPIAVGSDGSPISEAATRLAFEWARLLSVPVTAVRTWTGSSAVAAADPGAIQKRGRTALVIDWDAIARSEENELSNIIAPYRAQFPDVAVELRSRRGSAARELLHALDHAQMAIVGSKGWGRVRGALLGSTGQNVLHRADRPIVIYRTADS